MSTPSYKVTKLRNGTVIDHIAAGRALEVLQLLGLDADAAVAIGINFPSRKHGKKDIIKIEGRFLDVPQFSILSLISPSATVSIIRDFELDRKEPVVVPDEVTGRLRCPNARCITNHELDSTTRFAVTRADPLRLVCHYCERSFGRDQLRLR